MVHRISQTTDWEGSVVAASHEYIALKLFERGSEQGTSRTGGSLPDVVRNSSQRVSELRSGGSIVRMCGQTIHLVLL